MYVLIDNYKQMKQMQHKGELYSHIILPGSNEGKTNISDYIYYLYNGSKQALTSGTATPELNLKVQELKHYMQFITILEI